MSADEAGKREEKRKKQKASSLQRDKRVSLMRVSQSFDRISADGIIIICQNPIKESSSLFFLIRVCQYVYNKNNVLPNVIS